MKYFCAFIMVVALTACYPPDQPKYVIYLERSKVDIENIIEFAVTQAEKYSYAYVLESLVDYKDVQTFFEASGNSWLYRSFNIGRSESAWIAVSQVWKRTRISLREAEGSHDLKSIFPEWEAFLDRSGYEYEVEYR